MRKGLDRLAWAAAAVAIAGLSACDKGKGEDEKRKQAETTADKPSEPAASRPAPALKRADEPKPAKPAAPPADVSSALANPAAATDTAPDTFRVKFETTKGDFVVEVTREWSPNGADRFYNLAKIGYFDGVRFFRVVKGFMAQFGIHGDPAVATKWMTATIPDDPVVKSNQRSYITFAKSSAPNSRSTQFFINYVDNKSLDRMGFAPFGKVIEGMDVVDKLEGKYGEQTTRRQGEIVTQGNAWLDETFPGLDSIEKATLLSDGE